MRTPETPSAADALAFLAEQLAEQVADCLAPKLSALTVPSPASPWMTTTEAIEYTRLPEGTFRKLASSGKIPSHGGRAKLFYRPEVDHALLAFTGAAEEERRLRSVR